MIYIYIVRCSDNTYYTGITQNLSTRLTQHLSKRVSYTKKRLPIKLVHVEHRESRKDAAKQERYIKTKGAFKYLVRQYLGAMPDGIFINADVLNNNSFHELIITTFVSAP